MHPPIHNSITVRRTPSSTTPVGDTALQGAVVLEAARIWFERDKRATLPTARKA